MVNQTSIRDVRSKDEKQGDALCSEGEVLNAHVGWRVRVSTKLKQVIWKCALEKNE